MLDQRRRRWADVVEIMVLYKCFVFAVEWPVGLLAVGPLQCRPVL